MKYTLLICAALAPLTSQAVVVIDNLANGTQGFSTGVSSPDRTGIFASPNNQTALTVTTGPAGGTLTSIDLVIAVVDNTSPMIATMSTGASVPGGTNPVTIDTVAPTATSGITTITFSNAGVPMAANTTYWFHFTVASGQGSYSIINTNSQNEFLGWDLGNTWNLPTIGGWSEITSGVQARSRFNIAPVPEPATALLGSLAALILLRRRR